MSCIATVALSLNNSLVVTLDDWTTSLNKNLPNEHLIFIEPFTKPSNPTFGANKVVVACSNSLDNYTCRCLCFDSKVEPSACHFDIINEWCLMLTL